MDPRYVGRFAPSPTGPLHFGSLIAAVGSFADARANRGRWLMRMDDLDLTRVVRGAARSILATLEAFGLGWDGAVLYQSRRADAYAEALRRLRDHLHTYPCGCSRKEIMTMGRMGPEGPIYPGRCRLGLPPGRSARSERVRVPDISIGLVDRIHGPFEQRLADEVGDFVVRRADGIHAYQLAVVVDDVDQGINQVVRGADLLSSTPRQILLQQLLGLPRPGYAHLPVAVDDAGRKLSKSLAATPVDPGDPIPALQRAWAFLGQTPAPEPMTTVEEFWRFAVRHWRLAAVPRQRQRHLGVEPARAPPVPPGHGKATTGPI